MDCYWGGGGSTQGLGFRVLKKSSGPRLKILLQMSYTKALYGILKYGI